MSCLSKDGLVTWFVGVDNYFSHPADDSRGRRLALATLMVNGHARSSQIQKSLGIAARWHKQLDTQGASSFYQPRGVRGAAVLTAEISAQCQLLFSGLHRHLSLPKGYYSALHILCVLSFMALARIRRPGQLRHRPPGELGKTIGLDRVPEVRTLREKIARMAATGNPGQWMRDLAKTWMQDDPAEAGYLYHLPQNYKIDGLIEYGSEEIPGTTRIVNPAWRTLNQQIARLTTQLRRHQATLGAAAPPDPDDSADTLTIRIHCMSLPVHDRVIAQLLDDLSSANFLHPETGHRSIYQLVRPTLNAQKCAKSFSHRIRMSEVTANSIPGGGSVLL